MISDALRVFIWMVCLVAGSAFARNPFMIVTGGTSVPIVYDQNDSPVVEVAAKALAGDIAAITTVTPVLQSTVPSGGGAILAGTLGQSLLIDQLAANGKLSGADIRGKWETFSIQVVDNPAPGLSQALVILGSDPRGTAFGVFELSKRLGVSPWIYWADVRPEQRNELSVTLDQVVMGPPDVKYRGIFLNDEDFGLRPWAKSKIDPDVQDIGPNTYAFIFELMLRLKANIVWPAMHLGTRAFFGYEGNREMAKRYQIVIGSSHCEPMLRNNVDEWDHHFEKEYGREPGDWRYDTNGADIYTYWNDRVAQVANEGVNGCFTVGMRGIHDGSMPGPKTVPEKVALMNQVFRDQRAMLTNHFSKPLADIPQAFIPYAEVLSLYQAGAVPPEDVTIVWADDNHGYIRKLSNPEEQKRSGGSGVYYHLSYWMPPNQDYLWLCTISPALISYEMCKAYDYGANRMWIFNVGDLKPAEMELQFAMDLGWDVDAWRPSKAAGYAQVWADETFGRDAASEISAIKAEYYRLAANGKPEHANTVRRTMTEFNERLAAYSALVQRVDALKPRIPAHRQDAFFQLIEYPVKGAAKLNEKIIQLVKEDYPGAVAAYAEILAATAYYNTGTAGGKWNGMMDDSPRGLPVYDQPSAMPGIPIDLATDLVSIKSPMVYSNGWLFGTSPVVENRDTGGSAVIRFYSDRSTNGLLTFYVNCPSPKEDSFIVRVNGVEVIANNIQTGTKWEWKSIGTFDVKAGENTMEVIQREPNAKIGKIQLGTQVEQIIPKPILIKDEPKKQASLSAKVFQLSNTNSLQLVQGLGIEGSAISLADFTAEGIRPERVKEAPYASAQVDLPPGEYEVKLYGLPTFAIHEGRTLRAGISLGGSEFQIVDMDTVYYSAEWFDNIFRGHSVKTVSFLHDGSGPVELKVSLLDPGLALSRVEILPVNKTSQ